MADTPVGTIIFLLVVLVVVIVFFAILDKYLKSGAKKSAEKKTEPKKVAEKPIVKETVIETKTPTEMRIYNSELADDLNEMLKNSKNDETSRLQIQNHLDKKSNISKYLESKNYHSFDFGTVDDDIVEEDNQAPLTFTKEDYKRIMALSNIDDKK